MTTCRRNPVRADLPSRGKHAWGRTVFGPVSQAPARYCALMSIASLIVAISALVAAVASALYSRQQVIASRRQAVASERVTVIETKRLHHDLTPDLKITCKRQG